ncbi:MAG TPA: sulfotransferase [Candidatus Cybelea sp.]
MPASRAVFVLGMHRSGTSAIARGISALCVYLGNDFLDAQPENPTGYWEDRNLVALDDRVLESFGLRWDSIPRIDPRWFESRKVRKLQREAASYCSKTLASRPLWGFKDPRAIRVLPFWQNVLRDCGAQDSYVVAIRNPRSIAASLFARQRMVADDAYRLWLVYMVPFLHGVAKTPFVVVDYDLLMQDPRRELARTERALEIEAGGDEADRFVSEFLNPSLRHTSFSLDDLDVGTAAARLAKTAYVLLLGLAQDRLDPSRDFWPAWRELAVQVAALIPVAEPSRDPRFSLKRWLSRT